MNLFNGDRPNLEAFDVDVRRASHDLSDLLMLVAQTQSRLVESTHLLMVTAKVPRGATQKSLAQLGLNVENWQAGLADSVCKFAGSLPPAHLTRETFDRSALDALSAAHSLCVELKLARINETVLLCAALGHATPAVRELCASADIDIDGWRAQLEQKPRPGKSV